MCLAITFQCEVYYIGPSQLSNEADHHLTLPQFVYNSSNFLTNDTQLIFAPGNYSLDSEILVENVHSFSMSVEPIFSSKAVIICDHNARFEFRNINIVTVSGLDFVGCFENLVVFVGHYKFENSHFYGQTVVNGTVLTIDESTATLDRLAFISTVGTNLQDGVAYYFVNSSEYCPTDRTTGVLSRRSVVVITQSWFEGNSVGLGRVIDNYDSDIMIFNTTFVSNSATKYCNYNCCSSGGIVAANGLQGSTMKIYDSKFVQNIGEIVYAADTNLIIHYNTFINNTAGHISMLLALDTNMNISHSVFVGNAASSMVTVYYGREFTSIDHSKFTNNTGSIELYGADIISITHSEFVQNTVATNSFWGLFIDLNGDMITISHCEFVDNTGVSLIHLYGDMVTVSLNEFINNRLAVVVYIPYYILADNLTISKNAFIDNSAAVYDVFISSDCKPGFSSSFGSPRCIKCPRNWRKNVAIIVIANLVAGVAIVIFMLALNLTVAVGTLNGILFYANIIVANAETYFFPFLSPNIVTVFISWLNLDIGFDVCLFEGLQQFIKPLTQIAFPTYMILLVIIVIVASEYSSKFAKIIGKGNPVAVLATMISLSYARFLNVILGSIYLIYFGPAYGSRNADFSILLNTGVAALGGLSDSFQTYSYFLIIFSLLILLLGIFYTTLITFWQFFVQYQDKVICKWASYQKLRHFIEPYHAPYTTKYCYWTGLLLFVRGVISLISAVKFSFDPKVPVELLSTIVVIGGLLLLKGVTAKRVYKNWLLDIIETAIYFNLLAFSAITWYNLHSKKNQIAVAYTSVMIIFILLLGVIVFHVLRYTRLYKCSFVEKAFKWISSRLIKKKPKEEHPNDAPEEMNGYQFERPNDEELPTVTYSVVEIHQPAQNLNQEENETAY